jgi:hypothetical protein
VHAGTLPSPLATSISATYLDVSANQLTALPAEWTAGFTNATQSSFVNIFLQQNQIQVCFLTSTLLTYIQLMSFASNILQFYHLAANFYINKDKVVVKWQRQCTAVLARAVSCVQCLLLPGIAPWQGEMSCLHCLLRSIPI